MCIWFKQSFISLTRVGWGCVRFFTVKINFQPLYIFLEVDITIMSVDINPARISLIINCGFCWLPLARSFLKNIKYLSTQIHHLHFVNLYLQIHVIYILHKQKFKHFYSVLALYNYYSFCETCAFHFYGGISMFIF